MLCRGIGRGHQEEAVKKSIEKPNRLTRSRKAKKVRKEIKEIRIRFSLRLSASARECSIFSHLQTDFCAGLPKISGCCRTSAARRQNLSRNSARRCHGEPAQPRSAVVDSGGNHQANLPGWPRPPYAARGCTCRTQLIRKPRRPVLPRRDH